MSYLFSHFCHRSFSDQNCFVMLIHKNEFELGFLIFPIVYRRHNMANVTFSILRQVLKICQNLH